MITTPSHPKFGQIWGVYYWSNEFFVFFSSLLLNLAKQGVKNNGLEWNCSKMKLQKKKNKDRNAKSPW